MSVLHELELQLFGRGLVWHKQAQVHFATRKAIALLAYLAIEGSATRGRLAQLLWSGSNGELARNSLRKELYRIRETQVAPFLEISATNVTLNNFKVDVGMFFELAKHQHEAALDLATGQFLEGLELQGANEFETWLEQQRETIAQHQANLYSIKALRLEKLGDLRGALQARLSLVHLDPLQEVHQREVMRLHWALGERVAALERFDQLEQVLKNELGLKPLPETLALLERIEKTLPEIQEKTPSAIQRPNLQRPPLVGREHTWAWLEAQPHHVLLLGEIGIGKTRLCEDYANTKGGFLLLRGYPSAATTPFYVVAETLRRAIQEQKFLPKSMLPIWQHQLARLIPELDLSPAEQPSSSLDGRSRLIESLAQALRLAMQHSLILLLDDLHWFDPSSLELVAHLARQEIQILCTARALELSENQAATQMIHHLEREGLLHRQTLGQLSEIQTLALLQSLSGRNAPLFAKRLQIVSGGNPLFTLETIQGLFEAGLLSLEADGTWGSPIDQETQDYTELPIPQHVKDLVLGRIANLGAAVKRILEVATLCAEQFAAEDLLTSSALSESEAVNALERAVAAQMIQFDRGQYRFSHDLVRRSLLEEMSPERQHLIKNRLLEQLLKNQKDPSRIALLLEDLNRNQEAVTYWLKAAELARNLFAHQEARSIYNHAFGLEHSLVQEFLIHSHLADLELTLLNLDALEQHAIAMQALSHALEPQYGVQANLLSAKAHLYRGQFQAAFELTTATMEESSHENKAETLLLLGTALIGMGQLEVAKQRLLEGLQLQKRGTTAAELHSSLKEVYRRLGDLPAALEQAERARTIYKVLKNREQEITELAQIGQLLGLMGRKDESLEKLELAVKQARSYKLERVLTVALVLLCSQYMREGRFVVARPAIEEGLRLCKNKMQARECQFVAMLSRVQFRTGELGNAVQQGLIALELSQGLGLQQTIQQLWMAEMMIALQLYESANQYLEMCGKELVGTGVEHEVLYFALKAQMTLEQNQASEALHLLSLVAPLLEKVRLEYQLKALYCELQARVVLNQPELALAALANIKVQSQSWVATRLIAWKVLFGIETDTKKLFTSPIASLEYLELLEAIRCTSSGKQAQLLEKQIIDLRNTLELSLQVYPIGLTAFQNRPNFGTFLERQRI